MGYNPAEAGKRLAKFRKERGMSQEKFAAEFNVTRQYISLLERGLRSASIDLFVDISLKYDASLDYLILGKLGTEGDCRASIADLKKRIIQCINDYA